MIIITNEKGDEEKKFIFKGRPEYEDKGVQITKEEFQLYAIETLFNEYKIRDSNPIELNLDLESNTISFAFESSLGKIGYIIRLANDEINHQELNEIVSKEKNNFDYLRLAVAQFAKFGTIGKWEELKMGENGYRNDVMPFYMIRYELFSLTQDNFESSTEILEHNELLGKFANAWQNLDTKELIKYLDINFHYYSAWVFDVLACRSEYIKYLDGKFKTLRENNIQPKFEIVANEKNELALLFDQNGEKALFYIQTHNGKIMMAHMSLIPDEPSPIAQNETPNEENKRENKKKNWLSKLFKKDKST